MALDQITRLRSLLGESIPEDGGTEADTMFTDVQIQDFLDQTGSLTQAAYVGWLAKAGTYADLVTTVEGNAARNMSDLLNNSLKMVKLYEGNPGLRVAGQTRVGRIVRPGTGYV